MRKSRRRKVDKSRLNVKDQMILKNGIPYKLDDKGQPIITASSKTFEIKDKDVTDEQQDNIVNGEEPYFTI